MHYNVTMKRMYTDKVTGERKTAWDRVGVGFPFKTTNGMECIINQPLKKGKIYIFEATPKKKEETQPPPVPGE